MKKKGDTFSMALSYKQKFIFLLQWFQLQGFEDTPNRPHNNTKIADVCFKGVQQKVFVYSGGLKVE